MKSYSVTIQMKAVERYMYFPVVLCTSKTWLDIVNFESVVKCKMLRCEHSSNSCQVLVNLLSCGTFAFSL